MRILIAEDDAALAGFLRQGLQGEHYAVDVVEDGEQARAMGSEFDYDLVILDLNLPKLDGVSVLRHLRLKRPSLPVLVLTQRVKVEDRVQCLDTGADDYLPKPFSFSELSARIRALLRRSHLPSESVLVVEDLHLDRVEHRAERAGRRIDLTSKEFSLLEYLMRNAGRQVSRAMIIEHVWNLTFDTTTNVVDVYIFGFFDSGSAAIKPESLSALNRIASILAVRTCRLRIEGHTDNIPIHTVQMASNWELSTARATELIRVLITDHRFAPERLSAAGYAEFHPVASNLTPQGRAQNRRVDIVILSGQMAKPSSFPAPASAVPPSPSLK
jgi:two-component system copper resistance phosphate regulon response regulator CusR